MIRRFDNKELAFGIALAVLAVPLAAGLYLEFCRHWRWLLPIQWGTGALPQRRFGGNGGATLAEANDAFARAPRCGRFSGEAKAPPQANDAFAQAPRCGPCGATTATIR